MRFQGGDFTRLSDKIDALIEDYDYHLPPELVAQYPLAPRDASRLLVLDRATGEISHAHFRDLANWLDPNDLLVVNDTRVFPARLQGVKESGGRVELLLHHLPQPEGNGARQGPGQPPGPAAARPGASLRPRLAGRNHRPARTRSGGGAVLSRRERPCRRCWNMGKCRCRPISTARPASRTGTATRPGSPGKPGPWPAPPRACTLPLRCSRTWPRRGSRP